jgi:hypothetical protein
MCAASKWRKRCELKRAPNTAMNPSPLRRLRACSGSLAALQNVRGSAQFIAKICYASKANGIVHRHYVGEWADPYGRRLRITKVNATTASVSLFAEHQPLARLWYENRPITVKGLLAGKPSGESQSSFAAWLATRRSRSIKRLNGRARRGRA